MKEARPLRHCTDPVEIRTKCLAAVHAHRHDMLMCAILFLAVESRRLAMRPREAALEDTILSKELPPMTAVTSRRVLRAPQTSASYLILDVRSATQRVEPCSLQAAPRSACAPRPTVHRTWHGQD